MLLFQKYLNNYSTGTCIYISLHGTYGIIWLIKNRVFRDKKENNYMKLGSFVILITILSIYTSFGFIQLYGFGS